MKVCINKFSLMGTNREFFLQPGLNIITGSIFSGKTTLMKCLRGILGSNLQDFSREARNNITNLAGEVLIGNEIYQIIRPFVTTSDAKVSIAGEYENQRLPAMRGKREEQTYGTWLLDKLGLPTLRVLTAPTQAESDTNLLSINDYLMYCYLRQKEIDVNVFGHTDYSKNIKRKYVFEVLYGKYDVEIAQLQEQRVETVLEIRRLKNYTKTIEEFLSGTALENRASIIHNLTNIEHEIELSHLDSENLANEIRQRTNTDELRTNLLEIQQNIDEFRHNLQYEQYSLKQKQGLIAQLQTQSKRLTKSIVASSYLLDFDFLSCPRCGSSINTSRSNIDTCYLCLQHPEPQISQNDLIAEQNRLDRQISETFELVDAHSNAIAEIESSIKQFEDARQMLTDEINHRSRRYVSEQAEEIAQLEQHRVELQEQKKRLEEYLELYTRQDNAISGIEQLESLIEELDTQIDHAQSKVSEFESYIEYLDDIYQIILQEIQVPSFPDPGLSIIDRKTYLPIFEGRRFNEWQDSPGLTTMINTAHALAHQLTCLNFQLPLPNILLIDGLSGNMGYKNEDLERIEAIYNYVIKISQEYRDQLQIIIADNTVPENARQYVFAEFDDNNKLIPL
ncbi:hypothetical protein B9G53_01245 [Pseudanabaena sp. SR411]|uniref:ATP-binding protein n=1 Tax=Pseudanabaena sp. SR411 TaxID=1980935 RepID=UPI000B9975A3|nr:ATP-binding protein [Pseudanabaena sp. SR411]OYQ67404.1 hypothetical protein B9G53_01245 [Pseudanabaena sp. SR411]